MSIKLKALGLTVFAALAVGAFGVVNATARDGGHFVSDSPSHKTTILGTETGEHNLHFTVADPDVQGEIGCDEVEYHGLAEKGTETETATTTYTELTIEPTWNTCYTTPDGQHFEIHENGCHLNFTVATEPAVNHSTVHVECPRGPIEITHPSCNIQIPKQTVQGVTYTTIEIEGKHAITLDSTVEGITTHFESFGCVLIFGTTQEGIMSGSVTVEGIDPETGKRVNITAT